MSKQQDKQGKRGQQGTRQQSQEGGGKQQGHKQDNEGGQQAEGRSKQQNVYGEGNYAASKQYNDATRDFAKSGRVDEAARAAEPRSDADALQMQAAEAEGKRHSKGEDPALNRKDSGRHSKGEDPALNRKDSGLSPGTPSAPKPGEEE
jgi:hypothetical protein